MILKMVSVLQGSHIHTRVFMGEQRSSLALTGVLTLHVGEWQLFTAALIDGGRGLGQHLEVISEGNTAIVQELAKRQLADETNKVKL
jgi:hypothetical protein